VVVSKWENELDSKRMDDVLHGRVVVTDDKGMMPVKEAA